MHSNIRHFRRKQIIEATLSSISKKGFARTKLSDVAKEAGLSQGIISFYFLTKEALLFETLEHLATEYEVIWKDAVKRVGSDPVATLNAVIEVDLGVQVCNRKKVCVWTAFWAESPSRPKYRKRCRELLAAYREQTVSMCRHIAENGGHSNVDANRVGRGLNAMIDGNWLNLVVDPRSFDRAQAKLTCRMYLAGAFPAEFGSLSKVVNPRESQTTAKKGA